MTPDEGQIAEQLLSRTYVQLEATLQAVIKSSDRSGEFARLIEVEFPACSVRYRVIADYVLLCLSAVVQKLAREQLSR